MDNFNPLAPRGARLLILVMLLCQMHFNPLAPRGARLEKLTVGLGHSGHFNPLAPRGARPVIA